MTAIIERYSRVSEAGDRPAEVLHRGRLVDFDTAELHGWIEDGNGQLYDFSAADVVAEHDIAIGDAVRFSVAGERARDVRAEDDSAISAAAVRGCLLSYDDTDLCGWIESDDGALYVFSAADIVSDGEIKPGQSVSFFPKGERATGVSALEAEDPGPRRAVRGRLLSYDEAALCGWVESDDGGLHAFTADAVLGRAEIVPGQRVRFVAAGESAFEVEAAAAGGPLRTQVGYLLDYEPVALAGHIRAEDGRDYAFGVADLVGDGELGIGQPLAFVVDGDGAVVEVRAKEPRPVPRPIASRPPVSGVNAGFWQLDTPGAMPGRVDGARSGAPVVLPSSGNEPPLPSRVRWYAAVAMLSVGLVAAYQVWIEPPRESERLGLGYDARSDRSSPSLAASGVPDVPVLQEDAVADRPADAVSVVAESAPAVQAAEAAIRHAAKPSMKVPQERSSPAPEAPERGDVASSSPMSSTAVVARAAPSRVGRDRPAPAQEVAAVPAVAWWPAVAQADRLNLRYAGDLAEFSALVLLFDGSISDVAAASRYLRVTRADGTPVEGLWAVARNDRMLTLPVPAGRYRVTIAPGLSDRAGRTVGSPLSGLVIVR